MTRTLLGSLALCVFTVSCGGDASDDASNDPSVVACPTVSGAGTVHGGDITTNETWAASASPHRIESSVRILSEVTIEACAEVWIDEGLRITVGTSSTPGKLVTLGETLPSAGSGAARPVTFAATDPTKPWGSLVVDVLGQADLAATILRDGALPSSAQNGGGALLVYGVSSYAPSLTRSVRVRGLVVERARGYGVNLQRQSAFTEDSLGLTVRDSGGDAAPFPLLVEAGAVSTLPAGSVFSGNRINSIFVEPGTGMPSDTFEDHGVPYRIGGRLLVAPRQDGPASVLTIEPGVTLEMAKTSDSGLTLGTSATRQGLLVATGTPSAPITFTSAEATPAPADWSNIYFRNTPASGNSLAYAVVEYAGAFSGLQGYGCGPAENDGSVLIVPDSGRPSSAFVTSTTFRHAGGDTGLLLGWSSDESGPDFVSPNTFLDVPSCRVSRWRNVTGPACPGSVAGSPVCL